MRTKTKYIFGMLLSAILVLAFSGCVENAQTPFEEELTNPCNGETVIISGTYLYSPEEDGGGHLSIHGTGLGDLGNQYVVNGEVNVVIGTNTETDVANFNVITQGSAPNFKLKARYHTVDGEVIVDSYEEVCTNQ